MEKKVSDSKVEQVHQVRPEHLNGSMKSPVWLPSAIPTTM